MANILKKTNSNSAHVASSQSRRHLGDQLTAGDFLSSLDTIIKGDEEETLGSALSLVGSSHSPVFIFNNESKFLGLVSPYLAIYSKSYPYTTKATTTMFNPPIIIKETPLYRVAEHMISTKVYTLPVFDDHEELLGVIRVRDILQSLVSNHDLISSISKLIKPHAPITSSVDSTVGDIYQKFKKENISRVILVDDEKKLVGIVSRGDLLKAFIKPTSKQRFSGGGTARGFYSAEGEKKSREEKPVSKYYVALVNHCPEDSPRDKIISALIKSKYNSVVLVDKYNKPSGFLSTRDLLDAIAKLKPLKDVPLMMQNPSDAVGDKELEDAKKYLNLFGKKLGKSMKIDKIEVTTQESKNTHGQTIEFDTTLIVTPIAGKPLIAAAKQRVFLDSIQNATSIIEKQHKRTGFSKKETKTTK
jgi:predicted transcriptional regulator